MPTFRAANTVDLLFPARKDQVHHVRKLEKLPGDFDDLVDIRERTDIRNPTSHLEVQDRVILVIERAGWQDIYEVCCLRG